MRVRFERRVASPTLTAQPGQVLDLPDEVAEARIKAGHCVPVDQPKQGLGERLRRAVKSKTEPKTEQQDTPSEKWTVEQLKAYADEHDISLPPDGRKADLVAAIEAALKERE
ncbi:hypothetical protein [Streptomyces ipomoeae]|uniref:hypothetical protein n=1 Tax=Streptomyces ipomoeae TaxID=103232 RepID=UPI0011466D80|nr:hypothetical protein [Streptomyces ipomoeae]TQE35469.1 hypothetical protein Sipo7851_14505 [Streptomyces ipomoeae]